MRDSYKRLAVILAAVGALVSLGALGLIVGCGFGSGGGPNPNRGGSPTITVLVNLGDAPVDRVAELDMTINQLTLTTSSGGTLTLVNTPTKVEFRHVAGSLEPLAAVTLDADTFTQANITLGTVAHATVLDNTGLPRPPQTINLTATTFTVPLGTVMASTTPLVLDVDFNMTTSVNVDASFNVTINPSFNASLVPVATANLQVETGKIEDIDGAITSIAPPKFTIAVEQAPNALTFTTNSSTQFVGVAGLSALASNNLVEVTGAVQSDNSVLATRVETLDLTLGGLEADGMVTSLTGTPPISLQFLTQDEASPTLTLPTLGVPLTVNGLAAATFSEDTDEVDLTGLTLPAFAPSNLTKGQKVRATTSTPGASTITTSTLRLQQQAVTGQVLSSTAVCPGASGTSATAGTILLNLPSDSYLTLLTGETQVTVFQQTNTQCVGITTVTTGATLRARGLLLFNSAATPHWQMVASRLTSP